MEEQRMPRLAALFIPIGVVAFVVGGFSTIGEVLLHSPRFYTPVIALAFALVVTFGAAYLSWRESRRPAAQR